MIRRSILSVLAGVVFAAILSLSVTARASCVGFCLERVGNYLYVGCDISWWGDEIHVTCFYIEGPPPGDPNIAE